MGSRGLAPAARLQSNKGCRRNSPPHVSTPMLHWFLTYAQRYVRRHMHAVRVSHEEHIRSLGSRPVLLYMNHPSWWDPMIAAVLAKRYLPGYTHYTPIDADALQKYRFFAKLGFFGVNAADFQSQRKLLDIGGQVLSQPQSALWITPQGRFSDVRERPLQLGGAVAHLARRAPNCVVLPVAIEYVFWEERTPEVLVRFGAPLAGGDLKKAAELPNVLELHLEETLDSLGQMAIRRDSSLFKTILEGRAGIGGVYDVWRRLKASLHGKSFASTHGDRP